MRERKKITFTKDIRLMMYGFGDVKNPRIDTAEVLQNYMCYYLMNLLKKAQEMAHFKGKTKTDDVMYFLKRDGRKYNRVKELLATNEELKNARKAFDYEIYEKDEE